MNPTTTTSETVHQADEHSLGRIKQHVDSDRQFALISAFRGRDVDPNETPAQTKMLDEKLLVANRKENKRLMGMVKAWGYGWSMMVGHWIENKGTTQERDVKEESLFITAPIDDADFFDHMISLAAEFDQDGVIISRINRQTGQRETAVYLKNGSKDKDLGSFVPDFTDSGKRKLGNAYTQMRKGPRSANINADLAGGRFFVFENFVNEPDFMARLMIQAALADGVKETDLSADQQLIKERFNL